MLVKAVTIVPLEVVVRNIAAGSLCKQTGLELGTAVEPTLVEFYYKDDALGDPMITDSHALAMEIATKKELAKLKKMAEKINSLLKPFFKKRNFS